MALPPDIVAELSRRLTERAGLEPPGWVLESRARTRMAALGVEAGEYVELVGGPRGAAELAELIEAVRVGETRLFRHRSQVEALDAVVAPALRARGRRAIRVWSAGCATGEEPYTLAIVLARALPGWPISILATDVSAEALDVARGATYPATALEVVPPAWRDAFVVDGGAARVRPELAALVRFEQKNLVDGDQPRGFDVVWCRNVLIYFEAAARRRALDRLVAALDVGGYLFVGYSESLRDVLELDAVRAGDAIAYVKRGAPRAPVPRTAVTPPAGVLVTPPPARSAPAVPVIAAPPTDLALALRGRPDPATVTAELAARLATPGLRRLTVELDDAELLVDELVPVLRRARAAGRAAGVAVELRATRSAAARWLRRHGLEDAP